jgi:hypothetical protein
VRKPNLQPGRPADRRRALALLASSPKGHDEAILLAHGFTSTLLAALVRTGLAIRKSKHIGSMRQIEVVRLTITEAGRRVLAGDI